jgi:hypothetical protein
MYCTAHAHADTHTHTHTHTHTEAHTVSHTLTVMVGTTAWFHEQYITLHLLCPLTKLMVG